MNTRTSLAELSGGQNQRIAILRAMVVRPKRLFLDEPTSVLDPEMTAEVLDMIEVLKDSGTDFVLVTHAMNFARRVADEIAFIGDGKVLSHGPAESVFENTDNTRVASFLSKSYDEQSIKSRRKMLLRPKIIRLLLLANRYYLVQW